MQIETAVILGLSLVVSSCFIASADFSGEGARRAAYSECVGFWNGGERKISCARHMYGTTETPQE